MKVFDEDSKLLAKRRSIGGLGLFLKTAFQALLQGFNGSLNSTLDDAICFNTVQVCEDNDRFPNPWFASQQDWSLWGKKWFKMQYSLHRHREAYQCWPYREPWVLTAIQPSHQNSAKVTSWKLLNPQECDSSPTDVSDGMGSSETVDLSLAVHLEIDIINSLMGHQCTKLSIRIKVLTKFDMFIRRTGDKRKARCIFQSKVKFESVLSDQDSSKRPSDRKDEEGFKCFIWHFTRMLQ